MEGLTNYLSSSELESLQTFSDYVLAVAYLFIFIGIIYYIKSRTDVMFRGILLLFGALFLAAASTYFLEALTVHFNVHLLASLAKGLTASLALVLSCLVWRHMTEAMRFPNQNDLLEQNRFVTRVQNDLWRSIATLGELEILSLSDPLTGLRNRRGLIMQLENEILRFERQHQCLSVMMLDLDDFKSINDTYGHPVGDEVLVETANTISRLCRAIDTAGRFGGEEFFLVLPNTTAGEAIQLGERLCTEIAQLAIDAENSIVRFTCSIGAAQFMEDDTVDSIIKKADDALYEAKHRGKNQIVFQKLA